jgi:ADP-ribose diphosphatase
MDWEKVNERPLYDGYRTIVGRTFRLPDGVEREFEIKVEAPTAVVVALTDDDQVVLVREFRPGLEESLLEVPGGLVDDGEEPHDAARRELLEETGYAGDLRHVGTMADCAYSTRRRHVFAARGCRAVAEPTPEAGEAPEVVLLPLDAFREHLRSGELTDVGPAYLALDRLGLLERQPVTKTCWK